MHMHNAQDIMQLRLCSHNSVCIINVTILQLLSQDVAIKINQVIEATGISAHMHKVSFNV